MNALYGVQVCFPTHLRHNRNFCHRPKPHLPGSHGPDDLFASELGLSYPLTFIALVCCELNSGWTAMLKDFV
jgi:hypothetical protein